MSARDDHDELRGRVALVCGGAGPVGSAIAAGLAARGAAVIVHTRRRLAVAEQVVALLPGPATHIAVAADLADEDEAERLFAVAESSPGLPTIVVNAAYPAAPPRRVHDLSATDVAAHLIGLSAHVNLCRLALPGMRRAAGGRIVLISGALALRVFPGFAMYAAVKAGLGAFSRTLALEEGANGITVNVIAPGRVETPDGTAAFEPDPAYEQLDQVSRLRAALPVMATPQDLAELTAFLVSDRAAAVTGQVIQMAAGEPM
jgi:3-oxoacyl-[acyl-carrier protein] reductase